MMSHYKLLLKVVLIVAVAAFFTPKILANLPVCGSSKAPCNLMPTTAPLATLQG